MQAGRPRQGEIWWVRLPGQPNDPHLPRPALVISENVRNLHPRVDDFTVVPVFSRGNPGPTRVALPSGFGGISHASILRCEQLTTLNTVFFVGGPLGQPVPGHVVQDVIKGIRRSLGEVVS